MRTIQLDASHWNDKDDFYDSILVSLEAPPWHARSVDGLIDSVIFGGINGIEPPYELRIVGTSKANAKVLEELDFLKRAFEVARREYNDLHGHDPEVWLIAAP